MSDPVGPLTAELNSPSDTTQTSPLATWPQKIKLAIDKKTLAGVSLPARTGVYVLRIIPGAGGPAYEAYEGGIGAFSQDFWPASSVKVLAAIAAAQRLRMTYGLSRTVNLDYATGGYFDGDSFETTANAAITYSKGNTESNIAFSRMLQLGDIDWMRREFFTAKNGLPTTQLQRVYDGRAAYDALNRPQIIYTEGGKTYTEPAKRISSQAPPAGCRTNGDANNAQNCINLFELTEGFRRLMLHRELPTADRFKIADADVAALQRDACHAPTSFYREAVDALPANVRRICNKTGLVSGLDCIDHALIEMDNGDRLFIAATTPLIGSCTTRFSPFSRAVFSAISAAKGGVPLQHDSGTMQVRWKTQNGLLQVEAIATAADGFTFYVNGQRKQAGGRRATVTLTRGKTSGLLVVQALTQSRILAYRAIVLDASNPSGCVPATVSQRNCQNDGTDASTPPNQPSDPTGADAQIDATDNPTSIAENQPTGCNATSLPLPADATWIGIAVLLAKIIRRYFQTWLTRAFNERH